VKTEKLGVAESARAEASSIQWLLPLLAVAVLIPTAFWLANRAPEVKSQPPRLSTGGKTGFANRSKDDVSRVPRKSIDTIKGALAGTVLRFGTGSLKLLPESETKLNQIASTLKAYPGVHATIGGYTDNSGNAEANLALSRQRADIVKAELVRKGISADRLIAEGHGQEDAVADNSTEEGRAENRRVTVSASEP
jgi:outer membrane protein OmpA-like peptidoglycan-associated protein